MSSGMPELGSKISLISKADIRYEGRLFTVDPQECTIALASVRSFGTEDRETQYPVAPQSQVYDYILFRGSDIKDIRVLNNVPSLPNDPAIMQMSVPPSLGGGAAPGQFGGQFTHPVVGQTQYPQYHPMAGFPGSVHAQLNKTSELSPQTSVDLGQHPAQGPIGSGVAHHANQVKDQGSMLDLIGGGSQQGASRSGTPAVGGHRKSPTADQGTQSHAQVGSVASGSGQQRDSRRGSAGGGGGGTGGQKPRTRTDSRNRQRYPSGGPPSAPPQHQNQQQHHANQQHHPAQQHQQHHPGQQHQQHHPGQQHQQHHPGQHPHPGGAGAGGYRGGWRGRGRGGSRGTGRGFVPRNKNTLKFDNDYDFEQANTEFEELRSQLAKTKISDGDAKVETETEKKDDSGNETGAGEAEQEDDYTGYDKNKSFFDNISCEAVERVTNKDGASGARPEDEQDGYTGYDKKKSFFDNISCDAAERSKGRSQRTDWRTERKLNSETFGVALARRGAWRGRGGWRHSVQQGAPHNYNTFYANNYSWRPMRGGRGRGGYSQHNNQHTQHNNQHAAHNNQHPAPPQHNHNPRAPRPHTQPAGPEPAPAVQPEPAK